MKKWVAHVRAHFVKRGGGDFPPAGSMGPNRIWATPRRRCCSIKGCGRTASTGRRWLTVADPAQKFAS